MDGRGHPGRQYNHMTPEQEAVLRDIAEQVRHTSDRVDAIWAVLIGDDNHKGLVEVQRDHGEELATHRAAMRQWEILPPPPRADA